MSESIEQQPGSEKSSIKRIEEFAGFHDSPLILAAVGFGITFLSSFLPFASVSIAAFGGNLGAYEGSSPSGWFLSLPIGWVALLLGIVVVVCAVVLTKTEQSPSTDHALAYVMTGAGLLLLITEVFELFWVGHRVKEMAGFLGDAVDTTMAIGFLGMLLGAAVLTLGGVAALVGANSKATATGSTFGNA